MFLTDYFGSNKIPCTCFHSLTSFFPFLPALLSNETGKLLSHVITMIEKIAFAIPMAQVKSTHMYLYLCVYLPPHFEAKGTKYRTSKQILENNVYGRVSCKGFIYTLCFQGSQIAVNVQNNGLNTLLMEILTH